MFCVQFLVRGRWITYSERVLSFSHAAMLAAADPEGGRVTRAWPASDELLADFRAGERVD